MSRICALLMLVAAFFPATAWSRGNREPEQPIKHIEVVKEETAATQYLADQYYVQLHAGIGGVAFPGDKKKSKKLFDEILAALGGRKESREIGVRLLVTMGGFALPEYPLANYKLTEDGKIVLTDVGKHSFPMMRLRGVDKVTVNVIFRDARDLDYNLGELSKSVVALLPGGTLVSDISKPQFKQLTDVGSRLFSAVGSHSISHDHQEELGPSGAETKAMQLQLRTASGTAFGLVTLRLLATPTLLRAPVTVFDLKSDDLKRPAGEDLSGYEFELGGDKRTYLSEVRGLTQHAEMLKVRSDAAVQLYCREASKVLGGKHGLTMMDRTYLMLQSMKDAGFRLADRPSWFHACFNDPEKASLKLSLGVDPSQVIVSKALTYDQLYAFGCLLRQVTGQKCEEKSPRPQEVLGAVMNDSVSIIIDSAYMPSPSWGTAATKAALLDGLKASATNFSCIHDGTVLVRSLAGKVFVLRGDRAGEGDRISFLSIRPVDDTEWECVHSG